MISCCFVISHKAKKTCLRRRADTRSTFLPNQFFFCVLCLFRATLCFSPSKQSPTETRRSPQKESQAWVDAGKRRWWVGVIHAADRQIPSRVLAYLNAALSCPLPASATVNQSLWVSWTLQRSMCVNGCKKKRKKKKQHHLTGPL